MKSAPSCRVKLDAVLAVLPLRKKGYLDALVSSGEIEGDFLRIGVEVFAEIRAAFDRPDEWPFWALIPAMFRAEIDRGIGDTLGRELGGANGERFKRWHELTFGLWSEPCGRRAVQRLNRAYPYPRSPAAAPPQ